MTPGTLLQQITDYANRANPYPFYAELRKTPVARQDDGSYLVGGYYQVRSLLHDPRISSDARNLVGQDGTGLQVEEEAGVPPSMLRLDPPEHDRLRRMAMRPFGPPHTPRRVHEMRGELAQIVSGMIDDFQGKDQVV
ncbi:cytochrome P450, partial [Kitasatospora sp. NPDC048296]